MIPAHFDHPRFCDAVAGWVQFTGSSYTALAAATGVHRGTVANYLQRGTYATSVDTVVALAQFCGLSLDNFVRPAVRP